MSKLKIIKLEIQIKEQEDIQVSNGIMSVHEGTNIKHYSPLNSNKDIYDSLKKELFCQELNDKESDKQFTLDDMKKACACGIDICVKEGGNDFQPFEDLINSIVPPTI